MAQKLVKLVVVPGKRRLPGAALAEGKGLPHGGGLVEPVRVHQDALLPVLRPAHGHQVAPAQAAELPHGDAALLPHGHAVHAALFGQVPLAADVEVLREDAHGVIALRGNAVSRCGQEHRLRRAGEAGKVRRRVGTKGKGHKSASLWKMKKPAAAQAVSGHIRPRMGRGILFSSIAEAGVGINPAPCKRMRGGVK